MLDVCLAIFISSVALSNILVKPWVARLIDAAGQAGYAVPTWIGRPQIWEMVHAK